MLDFYRGKTVLVTGHTGFKGSWLCRILVNAGAKVIGYSLGLPTTPSLFQLADVESCMISVMGDIRDYENLKKIFDEYQPEIVLHLAAQPIVRDSYKDPRYTYETNVMGTVNLLECCRLTDSVKSVLNVTTDKVYLNDDIPDHPFREDEPLDGYDPYSNSKSCSELVTHSYKKCFFTDGRCAVSTARAGNVIGGGDFANDRIIPDCGLSTDIFAGYCTETEEDHQLSLSLMRECAYDSAFMFKYSERPGTYASRHLADDVPEETKVRRLEELIALQNQLSLESNQRAVGQTFEVLIEGTSKRSREQLFGRTGQNKVVIFDRGDLRPGQYVMVRITEATSATLKGEVVEKLDK